ncbi:MAG: 4'-phosphopantetheinyl transferase family protein, partial [Bacteroidota bacterium]
MALENLHEEKDRAWALWKIEEQEPALANEVNPFEVPPATITNPLKRLEFLAGRVLIKTLLNHWSIPFEGLTKDEFGKPYLKNSTFHISLSHSYPYVAAIIDRNIPVGIDLEQPKEKLLRIGHRVLSTSELRDAGTDVIKHCIYWCAKESLIKIYGKKDLHLAENLQISPFSPKKEGNLIGRIIVGINE